VSGQTRYRFLAESRLTTERAKERPDEEVIALAYAVIEGEAALETCRAEKERLREAVEDALGRHQITHIHAALREALAATPTSPAAEEEKA
jgi:hypothetical protein